MSTQRALRPVSGSDVFFVLAMVVALLVGAVATTAMIYHSKHQRGCPSYSTSSPSEPMGDSCLPSL